VVAASPGNPLEALERTMLRTRIVRDAVQVVVFFAAAMWGLYTFWYQARYVEEREVPSLVLTAKLEVLSERENVVAVRAMLRARNIGRGRAELAAYVLNLTGSRFEEAAMHQAISTATLADAGAGWSVTPGVTGAATLLSSVGQTYLPPTNSSLEPNDEFEETRVFLVPRGQFDLLEATWTAYYSTRGHHPTAEWIEREDTPHGIELRTCRKVRECQLSNSSVRTQEVLASPTP
jgi:hypothetical protein